MADLSAGQIMLALLFGTIGMGMFMYGKKTQHLICLGAGCVLMVFPYFVHNVWLLLLIGSMVTAVPLVVHD